MQSSDYCTAHVRQFFETPQSRPAIMTSQRSNDSETSNDTYCEKESLIRRERKNRSPKPTSVEPRKQHRKQTTPEVAVEDLPANVHESAAEDVPTDVDDCLPIKAKEIMENLKAYEFAKERDCKDKPTAQA